MKKTLPILRLNVEYKLIYDNGRFTYFVCNVCQKKLINSMQNLIDHWLANHSNITVNYKVFIKKKLYSFQNIMYILNFIKY